MFFKLTAKLFVICSNMTEEPLGETLSIEYIDDPPRYIQTLVDREPVHESPIDLNIAKTIPLECPPLNWHNMDIPPKKMKITNTGYTCNLELPKQCTLYFANLLVILSAKWHQERPYISDGPLLGNYVFSQLHFHWGKENSEGSEHTLDGVRYPLEMHAVFFKANYLTQEAALKEKDGIVVLVYIYKLQSGINNSFKILIENIMFVQKPHSSFKLNPVSITIFLQKFTKDYLMYWGSVTTTLCLHYILWLISREPVGVAGEQVGELRNLLDANDEILEGNFREVQPINDRKVFHVCPSGSKYATLLPLP